MQDNLDKIIIIDFGSQVTKLIARRIREHGVFSEIVHADSTIEEIKSHKPKGIILSGGPSSVTDEGAPTISKEIFELNIPVLGICYGQQLTCHLLGGKLEQSNSREFGRAEMEVVSASLLLEGITKKNYNVWMSHGDRVVDLPKGFKTIAKTLHAPFAAIENTEKRIYGVQFHPEVTHTEYGELLLENFVKKICGCTANWQTASFIESKTKEIREQVGKDKVICAVSGGVDSTVVATLLGKAIPDNLYCIFVNTGLLRKNEAEAVKQIFASLSINLIYIDASDRYFKELAGIIDPEQKRKIIGKLFIDIFEEEAKKIEGVKYLAQGTLYSDYIESSAKKGSSATIKSHHNVGGLPERMNLTLIEPLREVFKDEVRKIGRDLGLPEDLISRHPFPGPGLAVRIPGEVTREKVSILQEADNIYITLLKENNLYNKIWQAFCVLLPVKAVGVMGDNRTYEYALSVRAVTSFDGMTADIYEFEMSFLQKLSNSIINQVKGVNRVMYDITSKPPGTIEWE